jgi:hypothetical protein
LAVMAHVGSRVDAKHWQRHHCSFDNGATMEWVPIGTLADLEAQIADRYPAKHFEFGVCLRYCPTDKYAIELGMIYPVIINRWKRVTVFPDHPVGDNIGTTVFSKGYGDANNENWTACFGNGTVRRNGIGNGVRVFARRRHEAIANFDEDFDKLLASCDADEDAILNAPMYFENMGADTAEEFFIYAQHEEIDTFMQTLRLRPIKGRALKLKIESLRLRHGVRSPFGEIASSAAPIHVTTILRDGLENNEDKSTKLRNTLHTWKQDTAACMCLRYHYTSQEFGRNIGVTGVKVSDIGMNGRGVYFSEKSPIDPSWDHKWPKEEWKVAILRENYGDDSERDERKACADVMVVVHVPEVWLEAVERRPGAWSVSDVAAAGGKAEFILKNQIIAIIALY